MVVVTSDMLVVGGLCAASDSLATYGAIDICFA